MSLDFIVIVVSVLVILEAYAVISRHKKSLLVDG